MRAAIQPQPPAPRRPRRGRPTKNPEIGNPPRRFSQALEKTRPRCSKPRKKSARFSQGSENFQPVFPSLGKFSARFPASLKTPVSDQRRVQGNAPPHFPALGAGNVREDVGLSDFFGSSLAMSKPTKPKRKSRNSSGFTPTRTETIPIVNPISKSVIA